jgi:drug/metabolite transporter (DMT)-like permease
LPPPSPPPRPASSIDSPPCRRHRRRHRRAAAIAAALAAPPPSPPPSPRRRHRRATAIAAVIATAIATMGKALPHSQLTGCIRLTDYGNAFPMVAMAVAMTAAMAVARRWRRAAFIIIGDIKGVKYLFCLQGFKVLFQRRIYSTPTARKN